MRKQLRLGNVELEPYGDRLEDSGVGFPQSLGAGGRRVLWRHEHAIVGIELHGSIHVAGVQRLLVLVQQLLDLRSLTSVCRVRLMRCGRSPLRLLRLGGRDHDLKGKASGCDSQIGFHVQSLG